MSTTLYSKPCVPPSRYASFGNEYSLNCLPKEPLSVFFNVAIISSDVSAGIVLYISTLLFMMFFSESTEATTTLLIVKKPQSSLKFFLISFNSFLFIRFKPPNNNIFSEQIVLIYIIPHFKKARTFFPYNPRFFDYLIYGRHYLLNRRNTTRSELQKFTFF